MKIKFVSGAVRIAWLLLATPLFSTAQNYYINGPSEVDLSTCSIGGPDGTARITFLGMRDPNMRGPAQISFSGLPAGVTASVSPATLTFPGWVLGQQVTASFGIPGGVDFADAVINVTIADASHSNTYNMILHGHCPRLNKNFVIRGSFFSNLKGTIFPMDNAIVEIYREGWWGIEDWVNATTTDTNGNFEMHLAANDEDTYFAKLRLNDGQGVYMHDWWDPYIKSYNSANRSSNHNPVIDLGGTLIERDGGTTTPKTSIWQGSHAAFQEFIATNNSVPPTGDYEIVTQNTLTDMVWTARSTTNWEDKYGTLKFSNIKAIAPGQPGFDRYFTQFNNYSTNFHEFGHALRHTVDGDQPHFVSDAARYTYARKHDWCGSASGYIDIEGEAFNEGWAEYWAHDPSHDIKGTCSGLSLTDMTKEGAVCIDLNNIAITLDDCLKAGGSKTAAGTMAERKGMFSVINRGQNIMHSQGEFRSNFTQQFPSCALNPIGVGSSSSGLKINQMYKFNAARFRDVMQQLIKGQSAITQQLRLKVAKATEVQRKFLDCKDCHGYESALVSPPLLMGKIQYSNLIGQRLVRRLNTFTGLRDTSIQSQRNLVISQAKEDDAFKTALKRIAVKTVESCISLLQKMPDRTNGKGETALLYFQRKLKILSMKTPSANEAITILQLPPNGYDDKTRPIKK